MICFCITGTFSGLISTPRSPRATITPSVTARMASRFSMASGFSSLAMTGTFFRAREMAALARRTSFALRTKLTATKFAPCCNANTRSRWSFGVSAGMRSLTPGKLMPLCSPSSPPLTTVHNTEFDVVESTRNSISPSPSRMRSPRETSRGMRLYVVLTPMLVPAKSRVEIVKRCPACN